MSGWVSTLWHAWRSLCRRPAFIVLAVATLAIGTAAFTAALAVADGLLWCPPPFADMDRLVIYGADYPDDSIRSASPRLIEATADVPGIIARGAARFPKAVNVVLGDRRWLLHGQRVDTGFLDTLGIVPAAGARLRGQQGAMVSYDFWERELQGQHAAIGRTLLVDGHRFPIIGVLPRGYRFFGHVDIVVPMVVRGYADEIADNLVAVARLRPAVSVDAVSTALAMRVAADADHLGFNTVAGVRMDAGPLIGDLTRAARPMVLALLACAGIVLAVAAINVSNLLLGRGLARSRDTAIRMALGAQGTTSWTFALTEATVIGVMGAGLGVTLGSVVVRAFGDAMPDVWRVTALPIGVTTSVGLMAVAADVVLMLLAAACASVHDRMEDLLRERVAVDGQRGPARLARWTRRSMVLVQTILATALLVFGVAAIAHRVRLGRVAPGFDATGTTFAPLHLDVSTYPDRDDVLHLLDTLGKTPPADSIGPFAFANQLPLGDGLVMPFLDTSGRRRFVRYVVTTPGAAQAMGLRLLAGRWLQNEDGSSAPPMALVNSAFVDAMGGSLGAFLRPDSHVAAMQPPRVVGIVADTRVAGPEERAVATVFVPLAQVDPAVYAFIRRLMPMYAIWRSTGDTPAADQDRLGMRLRTVAPDLAPGTPTRLDELIHAAAARESRNAVLLAVLSLSALFLAVVGVYASQSVDLSAYRRDLALRAVFGAPGGHLVHRVVTSHLVTATCGAVTGGSIAFLVRPHMPFDGIDTNAFVIAILVFLAAMFAAAVAPAWRAVTIEPLAVLRGG